MVVLRKLSVVLGLCFGLAAGGLATAGFAGAKDQGTFDLQIRGITAGVLAFSGTNDGKTYGVAGQLESTGLAAFLRKVRFDAKASGRISKGVWLPGRYDEQADTGKRQSQSRLEYKGGIPRELLKESRVGNPNYVDPATQKGTVDPLTALYAMLRDVPVAEACKLKLFMFDGARRSQIVLGSAEPKGDTITCPGEYRRLAGFSTAEMAEKQRFAFRVTYGPAEAGFVRVISVSMDSLYGRAALTRR